MKIRRIRQKSGWKGWQVDFGLMQQPDGTRRRVQKSFATQDEAKTAMAAAKTKRQAHGDSAFGLTEDERIRFVAARDQLAAVGGTIEQAVAAFLRTAKALRDPMKLGLALKRCIAEKTAAGLRERSLAQLKNSCLSFVRGREDRLAHTVTRAEVQAWISGNKWAAKTQRTYLGDLRTFFSWAISRRIVVDSPAANSPTDPIVLLPEEDSPIGRLMVGEVKRLLRTAVRVPGDSDEDFRPLLWYVVLAVYAGIRPAEIERLDRRAVDVVEGHVVVAGSQSKTRQRRVVDLTPSACAWLALDPQRTGPMVPWNHLDRWQRLRKRAGVSDWPHDAARHTFASMHYAEHQDEAALKAQMGHSKAEETLMQHYRALATRKEAAEFWQFAPAKQRAAHWAKRPANFGERKRYRRIKPVSLG